MMTAWRRVCEIVARQLQDPGQRWNRLLRSMLVFFSMLILMTLFQAMKNLFVMGMTRLESQTVTVIFCSLMAGVVSYFLFEKEEALLRRITTEFNKRTQAEEQIAQERQLREMVAQNVGAGLAIISKDYRTVWANQVLKDLFGEVEGKPCYFVYNQREGICPGCGVREVFEEARDQAVHEQVGKNRDGEVIWSQIVATPIKDSHGEITSALELVVPITERKLAEIQIKESHDRLLTVLESLNAIVYAADIRSHEILYANRYTREIFGEVTGKLCWQALQTDQSGPCPFCTNDRLLTPDGEPTGVYPWEFQNTLNGRWYLIYDQAIRWTDGRLARLEIATDMTEQKQTEQLLKQQAKILDEIHDAVVLTDLNGLVTGWNKGAERLYGYSAAEVLGRHVSRLHPPDQRKFIETGIIGPLLEEGTHELEAELLKKSGETFFARLSLSLLQDAAGQTAGMVGYVIDISERKNYELGLVDLKDFYESVLQNIVDGVCVTDEGDRIRYANRAFISMLSINPQELLGAELFDGVLNDRLQASLQPFYLEAKQSGKPVSYDSIPVLSPAGSTIYVSGWLVPRMSDGNYQGMIFSALDVTGRKQTEDALRRSEEKFRNVFEYSPIGIELYDASGRLIELNRACLDIFGVTDRQEVIGFDLFQDPNLPSGIKAKLLDGEVVRYEQELDFDLVRREGLYQNTRSGTMVLDVIISALFRNTRSPTGFLVQVRDITARKRLDEELLKFKKLEATGVLAGGIAHDFNNLLSIILSNINIARLDLPPEYSPAILNNAEKAALRAKDLTDKFITFATGGAPLKRTMDLGKLLQDSAVLALSGSNVSHESSFHNNLWPVTIDEGQMRQAITNVIVNAREAMPEGGMVHISARNLEITAENKDLFQVMEESRYVEVSIEDHGAGIAQDHLERIFDPYFSTKDRGSDKGMGFGLAITLSVLKRHGGHVDVKSEGGVGTTVNLYLPASPQTHDADTLAPGQPSSIPKRILLMDDEAMMLDCSRITFQRLGYEVEVASNGDEAIQIYLEAYEQARPFDLAILDLTVKGGMGGKEAITILRKIDPYVKAIVSSGYSHDPIMRDFQEYGFSGALAKPYTMKQLEEVLHKVMDKSVLLTESSPIVLSLQCLRRDFE